ncbi:MAG: response regulator [Dehalococcoidia bacterium]|nr:response regulator [Dehalococcoidia bacterium]
MNGGFLVIEPCEGDAAFVARELRAAAPGRAVIVAASAEAALGLLDAGTAVPAMVFAAFDLPGGSGLELLGELRARHRFDRVAVALMGGELDDRQVLTCYRLGVAGLLSKPVRPFELRDAVRSFVGPTAARALPRRDWPTCSAA